MKKSQQEKAPRKLRVSPGRIGWLLSHYRIQPSAVAREARLRELMGLPARKTVEQGCSPEEQTTPVSRAPLETLGNLLRRADATTSGVGRRRRPLETKDNSESGARLRRRGLTP